MADEPPEDRRPARPALTRVYDFGRPEAEPEPVAREPLTEAEIAAMIVDEPDAPARETAAVKPAPRRPTSLTLRDRGRR